MNTIRLLLVAALISVVACSCAPEPTPQADDAIEGPAIAANDPQALPRPASAPLSDNRVELIFAGAFPARLSGEAGRCSLRRSGPIPGATWQVRSEELGVTPAFSLTIIAEPDAFDDPSIVVNVTGENRASYARRPGSRDDRLALAQDATSADVDVELKLVGTTSESLRVTGTIRCSAPFVTE
jgi:hypothetical protein